MMDAVDHTAAAAALHRWFKSQNLNTEDASIVISIYLAAIIVEYACTKADLDKGISALLRDIRALAENGFKHR